MSQSHPLLPLFLLVFVILIFAIIAFAIYSIATQVAETTTQKMERRNVSFSKSGMKVGVKHKGAEEEGDRVQSVLVKAWNYSTWPAYKSRFWNKDTGTPLASPPSQSRTTSYARHNSQSSPKGSKTS